MHYDFTTIYDRHGMDALAVDGVGSMPGFSPDAPKNGTTFLPMWVADMNFATVPTIPQAIAARIQHPLFGYFRPSDAYYKAIIDWQRTQNGVEGLLPEHIGYENGVLGGVVSALNVYCSKGDNVLVLSPTYVGFTSSLENNGYHIIHSELRKDEHGIWRMDYQDMEEKIIRHKIHATIVCSPHNPCGRVWERWELEQAMELFRKHDVMVVSDEIWSDLTMPGYQHIPTQSISEDAKLRTIALYAPSKTFNLAGLVGSYHVIYNKLLRDRVDKESSLSHYDEMNVLSMHALVGAYCRRPPVADRTARGAAIEHRLCLRFPRSAASRRDVLEAAGYLHGLRRLHPVLCGSRAHDGHDLKAWLGRGRGLAGWPSVPRRAPYPPESGPAARARH